MTCNKSMISHSSVQCTVYMAIALVAEVGLGYVRELFGFLSYSTWDLGLLGSDRTLIAVGTTIRNSRTLSIFRRSPSSYSKLSGLLGLFCQAQFLDFSSSLTHWPRYPGYIWSEGFIPKINLHILFPDQHCYPGLDRYFCHILYAYTYCSVTQ